MNNAFSYRSFIAGVIVGVLLAGAYALSSNTPLMSLPLTQPPATATSSLPESGAVAVSDQAAGPDVLIDSVTVPPPGVWVAIRETNGSDLGNVLGAVRVGNPRSKVDIPLLRATAPNQTYAVELYRDDNNGSFDPALNSVYVDFTTGERVVVFFKTTQ